MSCCGGGAKQQQPASDTHLDFPNANSSSTPLPDKPQTPSPYHAVLKILVLGDSGKARQKTVCFVNLFPKGVGKTCLILRYSEDQFQENFLSTIGIDLKAKVLDLDEKKIKLQIWYCELLH